MAKAEEKLQLLSLCVKFLREKGLDTPLFQLRLKNEIKELANQDEYGYFLDLYRTESKFDHNENNNLIPLLLGLVNDFDITKTSEFVYLDFPDVDTDYLKTVRDYLKNDWAPHEFGQDYVCAISNYTTFLLKSSLVDMARVFGLDRKDVLGVTKKLSAKDDEGHALSWDKALELFPDLKKYCEENPAVAAAARKLVGRNRGMGMHAGGLVVSSVPISDIIPLVKGKDDQYVSAFTEGLHSTELSPLGLVKYDLLIINDLDKVYLCCKLIKERHGNIPICALPGKDDWSDLTYLNDPKCIKEANEGKLKCVFQFDSDGIREMARKGGVTGFDDLIAYSALYRPGPMGCFHEKTKVNTLNGSKFIFELKTWHDNILYLNNKGSISNTNRFLLIHSGMRKLVKIKTKSGREIVVTSDHKFLTSNKKFEKARDLRGKKIAMYSPI